MIALVLLSGSVRLGAQSASFDEVGRFYVQNFAPEDYGTGGQNWAVVQDARGFIYVGNSEGLLEYDGASWRLIPIPNRSIVRSLAIDAEGRIFVGAIGELGYLAPGPLGRLHYVSLLEHVPEQNRNFSNLWSTHALPEGVYFQAFDWLFRWQGGTIKVWRFDSHAARSFVLDDTLYVSTMAEGLLYMAPDDTLRQAPGGAMFAGKEVRVLVPDGADAYLAVTKQHGMFRCRSRAPPEAGCVRFSPGLTDVLTELRPYLGTALPDGGAAITTLRGGVMLLHRTGHLLRILDEASGLRGETVKCAYMDRQGGLWLGLENGLARVELTARLSHFDRSTGLAGSVIDVARHRGQLYAASNMGVFRLQPAAEGAAPRFVAVPRPAEECWSLLSTDQGMLAGCRHGVYNVDERQLIWPYPGHVFVLHRSRQDPTQLYLGLLDGLARVTLRGGELRDFERIDGVWEPVRSIIEDAQGRLWIGARNAGVLRLETVPRTKAPVITRFGAAEGLPAGLIHARVLGDRMTFLSTSSDGLFRIGSEAGSVAFVPDTTFDAFLPRGSGSISDLAEDEQGRVWIAAGADSGVAHAQGDGSYRWRPTALRRAVMRAAAVTYAEAGGPVWVGGQHGLVRLDTAGSLDASVDYPVRIRRVTGADGTLLFGGQTTPSEHPPAAAGGQTGGAAEAGHTIEWPYRNNDLLFAFAAPRYDASERTQYRTYLDGFKRRTTKGDGWSAWGADTDKEYTNLWEGRYVFHVEARDVYGVVSREDTLDFRILPPWYRTWWAYSLYVLALAGVVSVYVRSHRKEVRREQQIAERERTANRRLLEADRLKDEFLATTSHELRTPLYGITGLVESLADGAKGQLPASVRQDLDMVVASGRRLSRLIDDILDFTKIRRDSLALDCRPVELHALADIVLTLSRPLVADKDLELCNAVGADLPPPWPTRTECSRSCTTWWATPSNSPTRDVSRSRPGPTAIGW